MRQASATAGGLLSALFMAMRTGAWQDTDAINKEIDLLLASLPKSIYNHKSPVSSSLPRSLPLALSPTIRDQYPPDIFHHLLNVAWIWCRIVRSWRTKCFSHRVRLLKKDRNFYRASEVAASPVLATIGMSVRPSGTRWHCVKTTQARITKSSPTDSPRTLLFGIKHSSGNSKGFTPNEGVKWEWGRENSQFSANNSPYLRNGAR